MFHRKKLNTSNICFWAALIIGYGIAFINGARLPTLWSINYYLPSFFDGFYRRSLVGTLLSVLGDLHYQYWIIAGIQLLTFISVNLIIIYKIKNQKLLRWLFILFLIGPAGGFMFHTIGYIEYILYLFLFLAISIKTNWVAYIIMLASLFVHEMALLTTIPLFIAYKIYRKDPLKDILLFGSSVIICFLILFIFLKEVPTDIVQKFVKKLESKSDFIIRNDYYELFGITYFKIWYTKEYLFQILLLSPLYISCYLIQTKQYGTINNKLSKIIIAVISIFATTAPLLLGLSGYDVNRWVFLTIVNSFFILSLYPNYIETYKKIIFAVLILYISIGHLHYFDKKYPRLQNIDDVDLFLPDLKESIFHKPEKY